MRVLISVLHRSLFSEAHNGARCEKTVIGTTFSRRVDLSAPDKDTFFPTGRTIMRQGARPFPRNHYRITVSSRPPQPPYSPVRPLSLVAQRMSLISNDSETVDERSKVASKEGPTYYLRPDPAFAWKMEQTEENLKPSRGAAILFEVPRR